MQEKELEPFSAQLEKWLKSDKPKTVANLNEVFAEKSLAIIILVLMFLPALPLPTGGISHVFEIIAMLVSLQLVIGLRTIWIPKRWEHMKIRGLGEKKAINFMVRRIKWLEKFSRPRFSYLMRSRAGLAFVGLFLFAYSLAAFLSPPFSGLDTLPSMGVVIMALSLILEDAAILLAGIVTGAGGVALIVGAGAIITSLFHHLHF
ncbi:MAG TPA: exopolysaccharide biosynthesis protein [Patescibacteria group bacterium]|nr:exopolysaccharide biosynthesis protein [Patescibacteria group bacterium]